MCYQRGISLNRETLFVGKPHWTLRGSSYREVRKSRRSGYSMLLFNEMQKARFEIVIVCSAVSVGPDLHL